MPNTIGRFDYRLLSGDKALMTPMAHICLKAWSPRDDGGINISATLTEVEIDGYVDALKADLDSVAKRAKSAIKRAKVRQIEE
jgi:hypothetical protein